MPWGQIILAIVKIAGALTEHAKNKQLLDAGQAVAIAKVQNETNQALKAAYNARNTTNADWVRAISEKYDRDRS